jgi:RHS repeat-associated protein
VRDSVSYSSNGDIHSIDGTLFTYDSNRRLKGVGSRDFAYNSRGNISHWESVSGSLTTIGYDARGLSSHFVKGGVQHYFDRDHQGVLLSHRQGSERDHYYFQGAQLLSERDGSSAQFKDYIYLNGQLIGVYDDSDGLNNVITGHLGQPVAMFNASGTLVWRGVVDGYDIAVEVESTPLKMRFPGQYAILGNGLYYNYHRDYDPSIGRYLQSDPIGLAGGMNTYAYVGENPIMRIDPLGLDWVYDTGTGTLSQTDSNGNVTNSWPAGSGPWGNGQLPPGDYTLPSGPVPVLPIHPNQSSYCDGAGNCWWQPITPNFPTNRNGLGIHPDGNVPGTAGCIGAKNNDTTDLYDALRNDQGPLTVK